MSIASSRRRGRRSVRPPETTVVEGGGGAPAVGGVSSANTLGTTASTIETIPSVIAPAPTTISQRRRAGITTPARRAMAPVRETAVVAAPPVSTGVETTDITKMSAVEAAALLWPAPATTVSRPVRGKQRRYGGGSYDEVLVKAQYLKGLGFPSAELVSFITASGMRGGEGAIGYVLSVVAGKTAPEGVDAAWYNQQIAEMDATLADAQKRVKRNIADLKASGKDYDSSDIDRIYKNAYPKWSDVYQRHAKAMPKHKAYEDKIAAYKARQAMLETVEVSDISIPATEQELAQAETERASGQSCPATVNTYKVKLKDGSVVLVQALQTTDNLEQGRDAAIAKAEAAGYSVAHATKRIGDETVSYKKMPTTEEANPVFEFTLNTQRGEKVYRAVSEDQAIRMAALAGLEVESVVSSNPVEMTNKERMDALRNAYTAGGSAYAEAYIMHSAIIPEDVAISATDDEIAQAATDQASGMSCPATVDTYRVRLKDGSTILVEALSKESAREKAEGEGYNVTRVAKRFSWETVPIDAGSVPVRLDDGGIVILPPEDAEILKGSDAYQNATGSEGQRLGAAYSSAVSEVRLFQQQVDSGVIRTVGGGEYIAQNDYDALPPHWQRYVDEYGITALQGKIDTTSAVLADFKQEDGTYDVYGALMAPTAWEEAAATQQATNFLFGANVTAQALADLKSMRVEVQAPSPVPEDINTDSGFVRWLKNMWQTLTPWEEAKGQTFKDWMFQPDFMLGDLKYRLTKDEEFKKWYEAQGHHELIMGYGPMITPVGPVTAGAGILQNIGRGAKWYWSAPAQAVMKLATKVPGLTTIPIIKMIPAATATMVRIASVGVPAYYSAAYIAESVKNLDLNRKWNVFSSLPEKEKDEWAQKCGYDKWEGLSDNEQAVVLARYAVPTDYTTTEWAAALGGYTEKLVELGQKGSDWLVGEDATNPDIVQAGPGDAAAQVGAFGIGAGVGLAESMMYMAAIPLALTNIMLRIPTGEAGAYTKWLVAGMIDFFKQVPGTFISGAYGAGRMVGLFVLSPESVYKAGKSTVAGLKPGFVSERVMAKSINTLRIVFSKPQIDLLSNMSASELKLLGARIVETLLKGENFVKDFGRIKLEVKTVPYQKVVGNALWHFTPDMTPFLKGTQVKIEGKFYTSPQAAISAGMQSLVKGIKATRPGLVEVRVPEGYTIKGAPIEKLLAGGRAIELEAPLKGTLDPMLGFQGRGVSQNIVFGSYPIRRFTLLGVDTPIAKLTLAKLAKLRVLAMREALSDFILGWNGRVQATRADLASSRRLRTVLQNISKSQKSLSESPDSVVGKDGRIISQIEFAHPSGGKARVNEKVRGLVVDKNGRVLFTRDRADPINVYDAVGGSVNVNEVIIPETGKWNYQLPTNKRPAVTWELALRSQVRGELDMVLRATNMKDLGMYRGKVGEHSVYGTRVYEVRADSPYLDRVKAWNRFQRQTYKYAQPELADAFWWDGKSTLKGEVQPWFYDMLAAVAKKYGWDMSKVKVTRSTGRYVRDAKFPERVINDKNSALTNAQRKAAEADFLNQTYNSLLLPGVKDYLYRSGVDLALVSELIRGRRQAVKWSSKPGQMRDTALAPVLQEFLKNMSTAVDKGKLPPELAAWATRLTKSLNRIKLREAFDAWTKNKTDANLKRLQREVAKVNQTLAKQVNDWAAKANVRDLVDSGVFSGRYVSYLDRLARVALGGGNPYVYPAWDDLPEYELLNLPGAEYALRYAEPYDSSRAFAYNTPYSPPTYADLRRYPVSADRAIRQIYDRYRPPAGYVPPPYKPPPTYPTPPYKPPYSRPPTPPRKPTIPPVQPHEYPGYVREVRAGKEPAPKAKVLSAPDMLREAHKRGLPILLWRMGELKKRDVWKAVIKPQEQTNLLTVIGTENLPVPPKKYATGLGSAAKTLQWLGKGPRHSGAADIGVVDVFWGRMGGDLKFGGGGLKTNVGARMETPTRGLTIETLGGGTEPSVAETKPAPKSRVVAASPAGAVIPQGSLTWASGAIDKGVSRVQRVRWYYLPSPYTGEPIPLSGPPHGAKNIESADPYETLQVIGRSRKGLRDADVNLNWATVKIRKGGIDVDYKGTSAESTPSETISRPGIPEPKPSESEVAAQLEAIEQEVAEPEAAETDGLSLELEDEPITEPLPPPKPKTRVGLPNKKPGRKALSQIDYAQTLRGFNAYTGEGL